MINLRSWDSFCRVSHCNKIRFRCLTLLFWQDSMLQAVCTAVSACPTAQRATDKKDATQLGRQVTS